MACPAVPFETTYATGQKLPWEEKGGSHERACLHVKCELKENDEVVHQQSAASEKFCDVLRRMVGVSNAPSLRVAGIMQVGASEKNCRQIATGWVLERSKTCETSGEEDL